MLDCNASDLDFYYVYDNENGIVFHLDGPGEAEDTIGRVVGNNMLVNAMFDGDDCVHFEGFAAAWVQNSVNFHSVQEPAFCLLLG